MSRLVRLGWGPAKGSAKTRTHRASLLPTASHPATAWPYRVYWAKDLQHVAPLQAPNIDSIKESTRTFSDPARTEAERLSCRQQLPTITYSRLHSVLASATAPASSGRGKPVMRFLSLRVSHKHQPGTAHSLPAEPEVRTIRPPADRESNWISFAESLPKDPSE